MRAGALCSPDQFVEFELHCFAIAILRVLDEEHHQERDDRCSGVNNELPCVGIVKEWSSECPHDNNSDGKHKHDGTSRGDGHTSGKLSKHIFFHSAYQYTLVTMPCIWGGSMVCSRSSITNDTTVSDTPGSSGRTVRKKE